MRQRAGTREEEQPEMGYLAQADKVTISTPKIRRNSELLYEFRVTTSDTEKREALSPLGSNIYPCAYCGEVFFKVHLLDHHKNVKHALSDLGEEDSGRNIVEIIFQTNWMNRERRPQVRRILKIHNSSKILDRFEEYREAVKARASRTGDRWQERCIVDGNEFLRFYCSTFTCHLGYKQDSSLCNHRFCSVCGIIRSGFSSKLDGICTYSSSDRAHESLPEDIEEDFSFMNAKRAILICRVIAGRIAQDQRLDLKESYDSVAGHCGNDSAMEELHVFSPRAVLPCFVIIYNM
ncbi:hypothetical protein EJ110_NYTH21959 [Nymphaea thermarum]|nr:hypothetical protein EJ110_NYTH21959 [Nymphaea thermarum]